MLIADRVADLTITVGGIGVIVAVLAIMVFLTAVAIPLFTGGKVTQSRVRRIAPIRGRVLFEAVDSHRTLLAALTDTGRLILVHLSSGRPIAASGIDPGRVAVTAFAHAPQTDEFVFGFADGTVRFGRLIFDARVVPAAKAPAGLTRLDARDRSDGRAIYSDLPGGLVRRLSVRVELDPPQKIADDRAISAIDYRSSGSAERPERVFLTVDAAGTGRLSRSESRTNLLTGEATVSVATATLPALPSRVEISQVLVTRDAHQVYIAEPTGRVYRFDTRDLDRPILAEVLDLFPGPTRLTSLSFLAGEQSIVAGGSDGSVNVYFRLRRPGAGSADGYTLVLAHRLERQGSAVQAIRPSRHSKMFLSADAAGEIWLRDSTSEQTLLKLAAPG